VSNSSTKVLINGNGALRNIAYSRDRIPRKDFTTNCKKLEDRDLDSDSSSPKDSLH
jgi:hypothetical protein